MADDDADDRILAKDALAESRLHWGSLTAKSAIGQGASFIVTLPTTQPTAQRISQPQEGGSF